MGLDDIVRDIQKSIVESQEIANRVTSLQCFSCETEIEVDPSTLVPEADGAVEWKIEPFDSAEPTEVRVYCSDGCRDDDRWRAVPDDE